MLNLAFVHLSPDEARTAFAVTRTDVRVPKGTVSAHSDGTRWGTNEPSVRGWVYSVPR